MSAMRPGAGYSVWFVWQPFPSDLASLRASFLRGPRGRIKVVDRDPPRIQRRLRIARERIRDHLADRTAVETHAFLRAAVEYRICGQSRNGRIGFGKSGKAV